MAADATTLRQHGALRLLVDGGLVAVQPADAAGPAAETLSVQLTSGQVSLSSVPALAPRSSSTVEALGLVGMLTFKAGSVLAAVTEAQQVRE